MLDGIKRVASGALVAVKDAGSPENINPDTKAVIDKMMGVGKQVSDKINALVAGAETNALLAKLRGQTSVAEDMGTPPPTEKLGLNASGVRPVFDNHLANSDPTHFRSVHGKGRYESPDTPTASPAP